MYFYTYLGYMKLDCTLRQSLQVYSSVNLEYRQLFLIHLGIFQRNTFFQTSFHNFNAISERGTVRRKTLELSSIYRVIKSQCATRSRPRAQLRPRKLRGTVFTPIDQHFFMRKDARDVTRKKICMRPAGHIPAARHLAAGVARP